MSANMSDSNETQPNAADGDVFVLVAESHDRCPRVTLFSRGVVHPKVQGTTRPVQECKSEHKHSSSTELRRLGQFMLRSISVFQWIDATRGTTPIVCYSCFTVLFYVVGDDEEVYIGSS
jgi:hypothetical protein